VVPGLQAMDFGAQLKPSDDVAMDTAEGQVRERVAPAVLTGVYAHE